ncbi:TIGR01777 family oxidoreductase [Spirulina subsalsa FACHB-351]|uniref:TIGR01777 family oxidoreductase n=1 Tax=Spirulina subsalsa FACHB-351 TaxID=234711 RepID=A0ABT3L8W4_9CYAN|nr:TIGR01777 family oxidoreductase [Spirulina subsalsa]MCW6037955.1 TIGR01777 family oxidoreductase [Spirulina subsalsa FACHB-351]
MSEQNLKIAITGGTGFVGTRLVEKLHNEGHTLVLLTRNENRAKRVFPPHVFPQVKIVPYTPTQSGNWQENIAGCDAVINLAGESIAEGRWTQERKQNIFESRQLGTRMIVEAIAQAHPKPTVLINPSAIGYYGTSETAIFEETSTPGNDFLAKVCQAWETEAEQVKTMGVRLVILRLGIVLGNGGAIAKMIPPFKLFAGGPIGSGKQWFSWIHREDLINLIIAALKQPNFAGIYNATAPNPVRMKTLCDTLGQLMNRPSWLPVPNFVLEALLGDGAIVVLEGQQVLPKATLATGFTYEYPTVDKALKEVLSH